MAKKINLTVDPMWQLLRRVTFPASIGSLFQTFYNLVDTFFAGKISPDALSALAKSFPIYFIIIAIGVGVGAGTNTLIGNSIGEKKEKVASLYVAQSIIFAIVISLLVTFVGINSSELPATVTRVLTRKYYFNQGISRYNFLLHSNSIDPNIFKWNIKRSRGYKKL